MLNQHRRFDYTPIDGRPAFRWPNGSGLAVHVALNLEQYAFGEGIVEALVPGGHQPDIANHSWLEDGNRVGALRLRDMLRELDLPCTLLINSALMGIALHAHCADQPFRLRHLRGSGPSEREVAARTSLPGTLGAPI